MSRFRKKSLKRKSSIQQILSSFRGTKSPGTKETPSCLGVCEAPEGRLARLQASISFVKCENTRFLLWSPEVLPHGGGGGAGVSRSQWEMQSDCNWKQFPCSCQWTRGTTNKNWEYYNPF
ncbi:hypothetical protein LOD99_11078 [Oopsacas minuta]|uniref:Uncharacterized protein n=1 Tax=Oopsacas minuta TaxID=111878 RepID=A0AAV7KAT7_9METZ|nr:hypothetical protein LOD99_11078 [Oopsacas minuta]